jgi:hypothetical protein
MTRDEALLEAEKCANSAVTAANRAAIVRGTPDQQQALATVAQAYATAGAVFTAIAALRGDS